MIFAVRQLQEKCIEQNKPFYSVFIDLTKAFDTINRETLWTVLERIGCPPKLVSMIRLFHDGMTGQVLFNGNVTDTIVISNGMKQGCILAPVFFNVFFTCMLSKIWRRGSTFTAWTASSSTCVDSQQRQRACKLSSSNCVIMAHAEQDLQRMRDHFSEASKLFGLTISLGKTEVLHQPAPYDQPLLPTTITIDDKPLANLEHFKYLGSTISCDGSLDREIDNRISKASQALGSLHTRVLSEHNIRLSTKLRIYNAVVLPSLLYGCETWTLYRRHIKKLELFHMQALHSILGIRGQDPITNLKVLDQAKSTSIEATIIKAQL